MAIQINWNKIKLYAISVIIPLALGGAAGLLISGSMDYETLNQPPLSPPSWLFPVVWTTLYILMGVSQGILKSNFQDDKNTDMIYYSQLVVNLLWPIAFFVFKWRLFAFFWILLLDALVALMVLRFYRKNNVAGYLQIPYLAWVVFASYLNLGVYLLN